MHASLRLFDPNFKNNVGNENKESEGNVKLDSNDGKKEKRRCC